MKIKCRICDAVYDARIYEHIILPFLLLAGYFTAYRIDDCPFCHADNTIRVLHDELDRPLLSKHENERQNMDQLPHYQEAK